RCTCIYFFFFSSRRRHTRFSRDWSSDVCSSDLLPWHRVVGAGGRILLPGEQGLEQRLRLETEGVTFRSGRVWLEQHQHQFGSRRSEERRVGKEGIGRGSTWRGGKKRRGAVCGVG